MKPRNFIIDLEKIGRIVSTMLSVGAILFLQISVAAQSYSKEDLYDIVNNYAFYDPSAICDSGTGSAGANGSALANLRNQTKLDSKWAAAITDAAHIEGVDPIAMASVLWWEHRGFPAYGAPAAPDDSDSNGRGPWQITKNSWPPSLGSYSTGVYDPVIATKAAAQVVKSKGGTPGLPIGWIDQDFSKGHNIPSIASFAKNYNAGEATWRDPASADWNGNRTWMQGGQGAWGGDKQGVIDDYIVGASYVYFQIAQGQQVAPFSSNDAYAQEGLKHKDQMRSFVFHDSGSTSAGTALTQDVNTNPACQCTSSSGAPVVVIDPGHSGEDKTVTDPTTNIDDHDYPNHPEMEDVFDVAGRVKAALEKDGYKVLMTKKTASDYVSLRDRAEVANQAKAAIAISIHDQAGSDGGLPFASANNFVYVQKVGLYRVAKDGSHVTFNDAGVAQKSQDYGNIFTQERSKAEGHSVTITDANLSGRSGLADGNIWLTQLFSKVPWIYNEAGGNSAGMSGLNDADKQKYADGLTKSIERAVPSTNAAQTQSGGGCTSNGAVQGNIVATAHNYAWDTPGHGPNQYQAKQSYQQDMPKINGSTTDFPFSDCGVFVSTVIRASGADPNYPKRGTGVQLAYIRQHPEKWEVHDDYKDIGRLQPGDVFVFSGANGEGHTYIYTGDFTSPTNHQHYTAASASWHGHVPEVDGVYFDQDGYHFTVARLKGAAAPSTGGPKAQ